MIINIGVVQFPGSNTERETFLAIQRANMNPLEILWNSDLELVQKCDGYIITGGFSDLFKNSIKTKVSQNRDITINGLMKISRLIK